MAKKRLFAERVLLEGTIEASLLEVWISSVDKHRAIPLNLSEADTQAFYRKKARLVLEVLL
mgnify:CR=1 FL=1